MKTTLIVSILMVVASQFVSDEVKAWFSWLHGKIRRVAVDMLPAECKERYSEEWEGDLAEIPGELFKLIYSLNLLRAALGIRAAARTVLVRSQAFSQVLKRSFDIAFSLSTLFLLAPLLAFVAIAVKVSSRGPVLYRATRFGKNGRSFRHLNFRTFTIMGDVRPTPIGSMLRRFSLDELPQLINILRGEMTIVGPRPATRISLCDNKTSYPSQLDMTPGLTGIWHVRNIQNSRPNAEGLSHSYSHLRFWLYLKNILQAAAFTFTGGANPSRRPNDYEDRDG